MRGIGFTGLLAILFIAFKLAGIIDWNWLWVLCPLWIGIALFLAFILVYIIVLLSKEGLTGLRRRNFRKKMGIRR